MTVAARAGTATASTGETRRIALALVTPVQMREQTSDRIVRQYAADMARPSQVFPPIVLFYDGARYWLADGMHRWLAAQTLRLPDMWACVLAGGEREAVEYAALEAPKDHSKVAYGEGDKQLRVKRMWETHPEWHHGGASNRLIAEACGVDEKTVRNARDRYDLTDLSAERSADKSPGDDALPSPAPMPEASTAAASPAPEPATPTPTKTVTRTSKLGKTTTYQQRQRTRQRQQTTETAAKDEHMALDTLAPSEEGDTPAAAAATDSTEDSGGDPFLGMKIGTVIHLMADFHNKVRAALGSDTPDKETLDAWWQSVESRDWQAFQEHYDWLRVFLIPLNDYIGHLHTYNGKRTTPPMVRQLTPTRGKRHA